MLLTWNIRDVIESADFRAIILYQLQPLPVTEDDDEPEYEIDRILDRKRCRGKFEYLVQYKGYPLLKDCQWRPHDELSVTAPIILEEFTAQFSKEPAVNILNKRKRNTVQNQSS